MRDPKRIDALLSQIRVIWEKSPDLRLGQLICNVIDEDEDPYNVEDEVLAHRLEAFYTTKISPELARALEVRIKEGIRASRLIERVQSQSPIRTATPSESEAQEREEADARRDETLKNGGGGYGAL